MTMATASPTKRTVPALNAGRLKASPSGTNPWLGATPMPSPVSIATTPGIADASLLSIDAIVPWATVERTKAA